MYNIDLKTLLQMLQEAQQTGTLSAELPPGIFGAREVCRASLFIQAGEVSFCSIKTSNGQLIFEGVDALTQLFRIGTLDWTFAIGERRSISSAAPLELIPTSPIPQRIAYVDSLQMHRWPRTVRRTYALIDGTRTVDEIAAVLSLPGGKAEVAAILNQLQKAGFIRILIP